MAGCSPRACSGSFKDTLVAATDVYLNCESIDPIDAKAIERNLATMVEANKPETDAQPAPSDWNAVIDQVYGSDLRVSVTRPDNKPKLLMVAWSFGIDCGNDSLLLVYERDTSRWKQVLRWQSKGDESISDAFGDFFQYAVVPLGATGSWAVAVAHGHPWCTSRWSGFDLDVIAPAQDRLSQRVLFHKKAGYVRFEDVGPVMKAKQDGFDLRLEVGLMDSDIMTRRGVYRFRTTGKNIERIQPIAMNGRDFVDEWLNVKWADAERWSSPEHLVQLKSEHDRIERRLQPDSKDYPSFSYGAVRGCSDDRNHFQVETNEDPSNPMYFQILQGTNSFTMQSMSQQSNPLCKGPDLMRTH
jgi:hypothetical protein